MDKAIGEARKAGTPPALIHTIECTATEECIRERLLKRLEEPAPRAAALPDMRLQIFKGQKASYEEKKTPRVIIDTGSPFNDVILKVIKEIFCGPAVIGNRG